MAGNKTPKKQPSQAQANYKAGQSAFRNPQYVQGQRTYAEPRRDRYSYSTVGPSGQTPSGMLEASNKTRAGYRQNRMNDPRNRPDLMGAEGVKTKEILAELNNKAGNGRNLRGVMQVLQQRNIAPQSSAGKKAIETAKLRDAQADALIAEARRQDALIREQNQRKLQRIQNPGQTLRGYLSRKADIANRNIAVPVPSEKALRKVGVRQPMQLDQPDSSPVVRGGRNVTIQSQGRRVLLPQTGHNARRYKPPVQQPGKPKMPAMPRGGPGMLGMAIAGGLGTLTKKILNNNQREMRSR